MPVPAAPTTRAALAGRAAPTGRALGVVLALAGCAALAGCGSSTPAHRPPPAVTGQPTRMSGYDDAVRIDAEPQSSTPGGGACPGLSGGGLTDGTYVLTSARVVAGAATVRVSNRFGQHVTGRVLSVDPALDVAWVYAPGLRSRPTSPAHTGDHIAPAFVFVPRGDTVTIVTSVEIERTMRTSRDIYGANPATRPVYVLHLRRPLEVEARGAPVLDDDGHVLGVAIAGLIGSTEVVALAGDAVAASAATRALGAIASPATAAPRTVRCATAAG